MIDRAIHEALDQSELDADLVRIRTLSAGPTGAVRLLDLSDESTWIAKIVPAIEQITLVEQQRALVLLAATDSVMVPAIVGVFSVAGYGVMLMEYVEPEIPTTADWVQFGEHLARLHRHQLRPMPELYGLDHDNHCGATVQCNAPTDDWVKFNQEQRLGAQFRLAWDVLQSGERARLSTLIDRLSEFLPARPSTGLLHGDLWSGNCLATRGGIAVIDPAPYFGDAWADVAMMKLFGGIPEACFAAHQELLGTPAAKGQRIAVYQLYHLLNHVNLFGRGYVAQAMSIVEQLGF